MADLRGPAAQWTDDDPTAAPTASLLYFTEDANGFIETTDDPLEATHMWAMNANGMLDFVPIVAGTSRAALVADWVTLLTIPNA